MHCGSTFWIELVKILKENAHNAILTLSQTKWTDLFSVYRLLKALLKREPDSKLEAEHEIY